MSRIRLIVLVSVAVVLGLLVLLHVAGLNGPWYWTWGWRRLPAARLYATLLVAAAPFFVAQWVHVLRRGRTALAILLLMSAAFLMQVLALMNQNPSLSVDSLRKRVTYNVASPTVTSYFLDSLTFTNLPDWLADYPDRLRGFQGHSRNKPPGPILYHVAVIKTLGFGVGATTWAGLLIGLLATLSIPATYWFICTLVRDKEAAFGGASLMALSPSLLLFLPQFDQTYPVLACLALTSWVHALRSRSFASGALFGITIFVISFFAYHLLVIGAFVAAWGIRTAVRGRAEAWAVVKQAAIGSGVVVALYVLLWIATGFDPVATFSTALANQEEAARQLARPYPATVLFDLTDFALGAGWMAGVLSLYFFVATRHRRRRACFVPAGICVGQIVLVAATGLVTTETARVWTFLVPLLLVPAGLELASRPVSYRLTAYGLQWWLTATVAGNMRFLW